MWGQFLLSLSFFLTICGRSIAFPAPERSSALSRRAGVLNSNIAEPWPKQGESHVIKYCLARSGDEDIDTKLLTWFGLAIDLWENPPIIKRQNRAFKLPIKYQKSPSCPTTGKHNDLLVVSVTDGDQVYTTLGFKYGREHKMEIGRDFFKVESHIKVMSETKKIHKRIGRIAHELGRNMGLPNENQVNSEYFVVICEHLQGYSDYDEETAKKACRDLATAIEIGWKAAMQIAPYKILQSADSQIVEVTNSQVVASPRPWDDQSIMMLATGTFGGRSQLLNIRKGVLYVLHGGGSNIDTPIPVDWYEKGPSLGDLRALLKFYGAVEALDMLEGETPPPRYEADVSPPGYVYDNQDALFLMGCVSQPLLA